MTRSEIECEKTWRLRARLTLLNKAKKGATVSANGMASLTLESIERERTLLRDELAKRSNRGR